MAFSATDLGTIEAAIAGGVLTVRFADGRTVTYQTVSDLLKARAAIRADIDAQAATAAPRVTRVVHVRV